MLQYQSFEEDMDEAPHTVVAQTGFLSTDDGERAYHKVLLQDLQPGMRYRYRVVMPTLGYYSPYYTFETALEDPGDFRFLYLTDSQSVTISDYREYWGNCLKQALAEYPDVAFIAHGGDLIDRPHEVYTHWNGFFAATDDILYSRSFLPIIGNHEYMEGGTATYQTFFNLPEQGGAPSTYSFVYGDALFLFLNSSEHTSAQADWMREVIRREGEGKWIIAVLHIGVFGGSESRKHHETFLPVFEEFGVDLVLQGHDHLYMRSHMMDGNRKVDVPDKSLMDAGLGTVYMIPYTSGTKTYKDEQQSWQAVFWRPAYWQDPLKRMFAVISVQEKRLDILARTVEGEVIDTFSLYKD